MAFLGLAVMLFAFLYPEFKRKAKEGPVIFNILRWVTFFGFIWLVGFFVVYGILPYFEN